MAIPDALERLDLANLPFTAPIIQRFTQKVDLGPTFRLGGIGMKQERRAIDNLSGLCA